MRVSQWLLTPPCTVHGGLILSLTDTLGSLAVASKGHFMTGVSTDIGTSFVRPGGRVGDVLHAKAVLTGIGESFTLTSLSLCVDYNINSRKAIGVYPGWLHESSWWFGSLWMYESCFLHQQHIGTYWEFCKFVDHTKYVGRSSSHEVSAV